MADIQRIIDEVRFRLQSGDCELNDELKRLATEFADVCHAINVRLRRCGDYLKQGLRAEAIQLADADPNLLDAFATVDFPERSEWDEIASLYQLRGAEPLLSDVAQELNEAYSVQQPLEKLLDRHRLLALARAPLSQRLATVRKLADADPGSRFWDEDVREFEAARCKEIETGAAAAAERGDEVALGLLVTEISSGGWRQPPPAAVVQAVKRMAMQVVGDQLQAAFVSRNLDRGRMLRDQWQSLAPRSGGGNGAASNVSAALNWLVTEDSKSQSLQAQYAKLEALERLLVSSDASLAELERARKDLLKSRRDIPAAVSERLDARIARLRKQASAGRRRTIAIVAGSTTLAIALFAFLIWTNLRHSAATRIANSAEQMVNQGNLRQARELLDSNAWMTTSEQYLEVHAKLIEAEKKADDRSGRFRAAVERAKSAATAQQAEPAISEADRLAVTSDEQRVVDDVKNRFSRMVQENTVNEENRFQQQLSETTDLLDRLERAADNSSSDAVFADLLKATEQKCRDLRQTSARVKPALVSHVDAADARLARIQKGMINAGKRAGLIERLTAESCAIGEAADPDAHVRQFCRTLDEYGEVFPSDPRSTEFAEAAKDLDNWRGVLRWQQLAGRWKTLLPRTVKEARSRAGDCNAWLQEFAGSPAAPLMREYLTFLSSVVAREEDSSGDAKEGLHQKLLELFSGPLVEDVEMFVTLNGDRYYVRGRYEWADGKPIKYISGVRGDTNSATIRAGELNGKQSHESPQSVRRRKVRELMARTTLATWDATMQELAESLRNDRELDGFLQYYWLLRVLDFAQEGNSILAPELDLIVKALRAAGIKLSAKWMDPKDSDAAAARKSARAALAAVKNMKGPFDRADERAAEFSRQLFEHFIPVGWLMADSRGSWQCLSAASLKLKPGTVFWTLLPAGDEPTASWLKIGELGVGDLLKLEQGAKTKLRQGRLLFIRQVRP